MFARAKKLNNDDSTPQVVGYLYNTRIYEGQLIELEEDKHFSEKWMVRVDGTDPEPVKEKPIKRDKAVNKAQVI